MVGCVECSDGRMPSKIYDVVVYYEFCFIILVDEKKLLQPFALLTVHYMDCSWSCDGDL